MCGAEWLVCVVGLGRLGCLSKPEPRIGSFKKGDEKDKLRQWPRGRVEPQLFSSALYPAQVPKYIGTPQWSSSWGDQPMDFVVKAGKAGRAGNRTICSQYSEQGKFKTFWLVPNNGSAPRPIGRPAGGGLASRWGG